DVSSPEIDDYLTDDFPRFFEALGHYLNKVDDQFSSTIDASPREKLKLVSLIDQPAMLFEVIASEDSTASAQENSVSGELLYRSLIEVAKRIEKHTGNSFE